MNHPSLASWLDWQSNLNPNRMELGLERVRAVWSRLASAGLSCPVITVGGTNGKGSCVALVESMAAAGGYRVGSYSSPHLVRYNERVRLAGETVSDSALCRAFEQVELARADIPLTYFEFGTLAALTLFGESALDLVVLEVGLGGRLDAVNLIDADVAVVTSIGRDHTDWLGDTLEAIAGEKAGIFRPGRPAVIGQPDAPIRLREEAERLGAQVLQVGLEIGAVRQPGSWTWSGPQGERLTLPPPAMRGSFQYRNAAAAIAALRVLKDRLPLPVGALRTGLMRARLPGRFQVIPGEVTWILDVAHNPEAALTLAANLEAFHCQGRVWAVFGVLADKEPERIVPALAQRVDGWFLTQSADPRALGADQLAERLAGVLPGKSIRVIADLNLALSSAEAQSAAGDCILVCGSFTIVGAAVGRVGVAGMIAPG